MKTIREFVLSKVRRSELEGVVTVSLLAPADVAPGTFDAASLVAASFDAASFDGDPFVGKDPRDREEPTGAKGRGGASPGLGPFEVAVGSGAESIQFFARGMRSVSGLGLLYAEITRVDVDSSSNRSEERNPAEERKPTEELTLTLEVALTDGTSHVFHLPRFDAVVVHATLRWIGHTRLARTIAD